MAGQHTKTEKYNLLSIYSHFTMHLIRQHWKGVSHTLALFTSHTWRPVDSGLWNRTSNPNAWSVGLVGSGACSYEEDYSIFSP